jgi:muramidase (phage lysozyme)
MDMSNIKIFGNHSPVVGVKEYYSINELFGNSVPKQNFLPEYQVASNDQVKWSVWIFERGSWRKTKENDKTGITVDYIFYQKSLAREAIKLSVEVNGEKAIFDIKPLKTSQAKIVHVDLLDVNLSKPTKPFAYGDWIVARVHCVGMDRFSLAVTLWEDDGDKTKQNTTNVRIQEKKGIVLNGKADVSFQLKPSFAWLANAKLAEGDTSEGEYHEYYVTAEFLERKSKRIPSLNTNVPNPDYKQEVVIKQTPAEKKGPSKKEVKGISKSQDKVYDYHETKVVIKPTLEFNPVWEKINSILKVNVDENWWKKKEEKKGICESEARVRAFMRMVRVGEATGELIKSYDRKLKKSVYINNDFQKGYTTAYAFNQITDLSTHPQKIFNEESSAAGAYQVMRYTWWELAGFEVERKKKTGKYFENRDLLKKYKVEDYKAESQDKICLIIMKKQRPKLIDKIILNKIEAAIKEDGCYIWASLPEEGDNSHYELNGKRQPATPLKICIEHYNKFLKEELADISNLHLKKGFLKKFGYNCCDEETISRTDCGDKIDIDLRSKMIFSSQAAGSTNCGAIARNIVAQVEGIYAEGSGESKSHAYFQLALENEGATKLIFDKTKSLEAIRYIDKSLEAGYPLRAGVNHTFGRDYNEEDIPTTDHYVVIVGRKCENGVLTYLYWDVGTSRGESANYKFQLLDGYKLINKSAHGKGNSDDKTFTVTQITRNFKDGKII